MKSQHDHMEGRYYFECHCGCPDHLLCVDVEDEDFYPEINFQFISVYNDPWYKRVKSAFKFIFFKQKYGIGDVVAFSERNLEALEEIVGVIKRFKSLERTRELKKNLQDIDVTYHSGIKIHVSESDGETKFPNAHFCYKGENNYKLVLGYGEALCSMCRDNHKSFDLFMSDEELQKYKDERLSKKMTQESIKRREADNFKACMKDSMTEEIMVDAYKEKCPNCKGLGYIGTSIGSNTFRGTMFPCDHCNGTGVKK